MSLSEKSKDCLELSRQARRRVRRAAILGGYALGIPALMFLVYQIRIVNGRVVRRQQVGANRWASNSLKSRNVKVQHRIIGSPNLMCRNN